MNILDDIRRTCPVYAWATRRFRAELPLTSGHVVRLSYTMPLDEKEDMPSISWEQVKEYWGEYLEADTEEKRKGVCEAIAENLNEQVKLEMTILTRQLNASANLLAAINMDQFLGVYVAYNTLLEALILSLDEAHDYGWNEWLELVRISQFGPSFS